MRNSINLIGPVEPTGMSWLINCCLELNLKCSIDGETWEAIETGYKLNPEKAHLRRWLPALQDLDRSFQFDDSFAISWSHDWLDEKHLQQKTIFFSREPKTALYSGFKRLGNSEMSFSDYLMEIDPKWLLNRMQLWNLFHVIWSLHPNMKFFFFEDYKQRPLDTIKDVLEWIGVKEVTEIKAKHAIDSSTWERAKLSEEAYQRQMSINTPLMIRAGSTIIENEESEVEAYELIERECGQLNRLIRDGKLKNSYMEALSPQVFQRLENNLNVTPLIIVNKENDIRFTGIDNLTERSFQIAQRKRTETHLIASAQRQIFLNFRHDLEVIFQLKYGPSKTSRNVFFIHSSKAIVEIIVGKLQRVFRRNFGI